MARTSKGQYSAVKGNDTEETAHREESNGTGQENYVSLVSGVCECRNMEADKMASKINIKGQTSQCYYDN